MVVEVPKRLRLNKVQIEHELELLREEQAKLWSLLTVVQQGIYDTRVEAERQSEEIANLYRIIASLPARGEN